MVQPFHLSIGVRSIQESVDFFVNTLNGEVLHRDESGYVNIDVFGCQITLKNSSNINPELENFHFGFNMSLREFDMLTKNILQTNANIIMEPKVVDANTPLERKKMYLKCPTGYLVELKGYKSNDGLSYLSPRTEKRESGTHGMGLYAKERISKGEIVAIKGGYVMPRDEWANIEKTVGDAAEIQLSDDFVIAPRKKYEFEGCMMALNHSCEPNVGVNGQITYVAMKDISKDDELTLDYAMIDDYEGTMNCYCGESSCRKVIRGKDWQIKDLQVKYKGYFSSFIAEKILMGTV